MLPEQPLRVAKRTHAVTHGGPGGMSISEGPSPIRLHSCRCTLSQRRRKERRQSGLHSCRNPCSVRFAVIVCGPWTFMFSLQSLHDGNAMLRRT